MLSRLEISGFRGFASKQALEFAIPNGQPGSGLTVVVGPNNAGKSTIVESLKIIGSNQSTSITEGKRNKGAGDRVDISVTTTVGAQKAVRTGAGGGSETTIAWGGQSSGCQYWHFPQDVNLTRISGKANCREICMQIKTLFHLRVV